VTTGKARILTSAECIKVLQKCQKAEEKNFREWRKRNNGKKN